MVEMKEMVARAEASLLNEFREAQRRGKIPMSAGDVESVSFNTYRDGSGSLDFQTSEGQVWSPYFSQNTYEDLRDSYFWNGHYLPAIDGDMNKPPFITEEDIIEWKNDAINDGYETKADIDKYVAQKAQERIQSIIQDSELDEEAVIVYLDSGTNFVEWEWTQNTASAKRARRTHRKHSNMTRQQALRIQASGRRRMHSAYRARRFKRHGACRQRNARSATLTPMEKRLVSQCSVSKVESIERSSGREFDVHVSGMTKAEVYQIGGKSRRFEPVRFSGWLPLMAIHDMTNWTDPRIARMSDHPEMAMEGDWSGIRDTEKEKIWRIFETHILPRVRGGSQSARRQFDRVMLINGPWGQVKLSLVRSVETDEWVVKYYKNGKYDEGKTYYTGDLKDAIDTRNLVANRIRSGKQRV